MGAGNGVFSCRSTNSSASIRMVAYAISDDKCFRRFLILLLVLAAASAAAGWWLFGDSGIRLVLPDFGRT